MATPSTPTEAGIGRGIGSEASTGAGFRTEAPLRWFRYLMWAGIVANLVVASVSLVAPERLLVLLGLEPASPLVWPRFAAFLLILLSGFYVPGALDPLRNAYSAVGAVLTRFGGVAFFFLVGGGYVIFGLFDLVFGLPQAVLLLLARRRHSAV